MFDRPISLMEIIQHAARLVVRETDQPPTELPTPFTFGRHANRNLFHANSQVSCQHAIICEDAERFFIQDLCQRRSVRILPASFPLMALTHTSTWGSLCLTGVWHGFVFLGCTQEELQTRIGRTTSESTLHQVNDR